MHEWLCEHGVGHPLSSFVRSVPRGSGVHGCDGCCAKMRLRQKKLHALAGMVGPGWKNLVCNLVDDLLERGWDGHTQQIKEKLGGLRFYASVPTDECVDIIDDAEGASLATCECCGSPGRLRTSDDGLAYYLTLCDDCYAVRLGNIGVEVNEFYDAVNKMRWW